MSNGKSLYQILQINRGASKEAIDKSYQRLLDGLTNPNSDEAQNQQKALRYAYDVLTNPKLREHYDAKLKAEDEPMIEVAPSPQSWAAPGRIIAGVVILVLLAGFYNIWLGYKRERAAAELQKLKIEAEIYSQRAEAETQKKLQLEEAARREQANQEAIARVQASQDLTRIQNDMKALEYRERQQALKDKLAQERIESERQRRELEARRQANSRPYSGSYR